MSKVKSYLSLIKFSHTIFAMPFALIGFFLGLERLGHSINDLAPPEFFPEKNQWSFFKSIRTTIHSDGLIYYNADSLWTIMIIKLLLVIACMIFARSAAMAFNRYLDRHFDAKNPRTAIREIPSGIISSWNALLFTIISSILFIATAFFINDICFYLSPVALAVILGYSYTKRFTALCHLILGLGLSLAPIGAYLAVTGQFDWLPLLFSFAVICWVSGFDIIYALQDEEFDRSNDLYSMPAWLGKSKALRLSEVLHVCSAAFVIYAGWYGDFHGLYWIGAGVFVFMLIYQHSIVKPNDLRRVNVAFMTANGIASVVFAALVIGDMFILK